ncbi:hypothetical protein [Psychromonas algicola]|uniref:hypothetical protein n=1 Tax=Psychromonas algicola TaxID=2555642 RepID=UPI0010677D18|nr:hypothetical protein [Psychromonas sp. RZ5]TEW45723.1 hypothetical protein E2R67_13705 [Psychromonas sp. RZ5]
MSKVFEAMKYKLDLDSKSAPRISKAAKNISKSNLDGYEDLLLNALETLILKPQSWKAQSEVIRAIGILALKVHFLTLRDLP